MLKEYIYDNKFQIYIFGDYIDVINYLEIISFGEEKISIRSDINTIFISGNNLVITKLLNDEILIKGNIKNIEFR